jgi:hypothetical protein
MEQKKVIKSKFFWPWEDVEEERWLHEMSLQGLHLLTPGFFGRYTFVQGEPSNYIYRLDFISDTKGEGSPRPFADSGWHQIGEMGGWQYFRKEVAPGESTVIFTETETKMQKYQRLLMYLMVFMPIWAGVYVSINVQNPSPLQEFFTSLLMACVLLYVCIAAGVLWRITQLQEKI